MGNAVEFTVENTLTAGLKKFKRKLALEKTGGVDFGIKRDIGLQLINWIVNGSAKSDRTPPVKHGILRGSGSVFVGGHFVGDTRAGYPEGTPNTSYSGPMDLITIGFNTSYAVYMHEKNWNPGPVSSQSGDTGNKFVEMHLKADGKDLLGLYARFFKSRMGT